MDVIVAYLATFCLGAIVMYFLIIGDNAREIKIGIAPIKADKIRQIEENENENENETQKKKRKVRIYVDGCWDVMHSGHYNAIRQAKALGDILVVGVHNDTEIARNKREPVMKNEQRMAAVRACKWADEVIFDVPYVVSRELLKKLDCDYVAHGDDIPIAANGHSAYHTVMDKLKIFRRTPGVSTTQLIQRLLDAARTSYSSSSSSANGASQLQLQYELYDKDEEKTKHVESTSSWSSFLASSSRISAFSNNITPTKNDVVVYIDGVFDLFHIGHIAALKKAKQLGTFLYVGLYDDETVRLRKGKNFPLMNLQERVLNVLSCKYVDDILIGAPWKITKQVLKSLNVTYVVMTPNTKFAENEMDRYGVPQELGIFKQIKTDSNYTTDTLIQSIVQQQRQLETQNKNKLQKAKQYANNQKYVQEKTK